MSLGRYFIWLVAAFFFVPTAASAQEMARPGLPSPLNLQDAVHYALAHHPALRASAANEDEARAQLDLARARYLPFGDIGLQENRATGNVVPGAHFTMAGIPPISGPPTDRVFDSGDWGSTAGLSLWWDIAHLSEKIALADAALAQRAGARAGMQSQVLEVAFGAADAFAAAVAAGEEVKAARASVRRALVFETIVNALVHSGLRPGADGARAAAETAFAQTRQIRAEEAQRLAEAQLAQALGAAGERVAVVPGHLLQDAQRGRPERRVSPRNPLIAGASDAERAARDRAHAAALEFIPRVEIAAAIFGRADGLFPGGANLGFAQGLVPDTPNWAAGVVVTIPILQYPEIRAGADAAAADARLAVARRDEIVQQVRTQIDSAGAIVDSAYKIAAQARVSMDSSRAALSQAQARYKAGLYGVDPVAEALRLLAQGEAENAVARVDIWRAKLLQARAVGDIEPLMTEITQASGGR
jgi:outer membrane protein TolC